MTDGGTIMPPTMCEAGSGETDFFVVNVLDIGRDTGDGNVPGFNVDDTVSVMSDPESWAMGCEAEDFMSGPPDNIDGVDNQLGPILSDVGDAIDVTGTIEENIADGSLLLLVEVENIDDRTTDDCVTLNLYLGLLDLQDPAMSCTDSAECGDGSCDNDQCVVAPELDGSGALAAGQTFDIDMVSLMGGEPIITVVGTIAGGRLRAGPVDIGLNLPIADAMLELNITQAQVNATFQGDNIVDGVIGGALDVDETIAALGMIPDLASLGPVVENVIREQADLFPVDGTCSALSVGLTFDGVPATRGEVR